MSQLAASRVTRVARYGLLLGVLIATAGLLFMWQQARAAAAFVSTLHLPGTPAPGTSQLDAFATVAMFEVGLALAVAAVSALHVGRMSFASAAAWSGVTAATTIGALATLPSLQAVSAAQMMFSPVAPAILVLAGCATSALSAMIGWRVVPSENGVPTAYMPPPTHQN